MCHQPSARQREQIHKHGQHPGNNTALVACHGLMPVTVLLARICFVRAEDCVATWWRVFIVGSSCSHHGAFCGSMDQLGSTFGPSWGLSGPLWAREASWAPLGPAWGKLGASLEPAGGPCWGPPLGYFFRKRLARQIRVCRPSYHIGMARRARRI